jgi:N-hydroxyarylamine O-acetyltransferase
VLWGHEEGYEPETPTHMALAVDVGGVPYLADVGFGGQTLAGPLRLRADVEQTAGGEKYRLSGGHPKWRLETEIEGAWRPMYEFTLAEQTLDNYIAMNDLTMGLFRDNLTAARIDGSRRYALRNARLRTHENGATETRVLASVPEIREVLTNVFGIQLPDTDRLDPALEKALRPGAND